MCKKMDFYFLEGIYGYSGYCTEEKNDTRIEKILHSASHIYLICGGQICLNFGIGAHSFYK